MSLIWPNKDPDELLDYSIDWSDIAAGFNITGQTWSVRSNDYPTEFVLPAGKDLNTVNANTFVDSIHNISQVISGKNTIIYLAGGENRRDYTFICTITTDISTTIQRAVILRCRSV